MSDKTIDVSTSQRGTISYRSLYYTGQSAGSGSYSVVSGSHTRKRIPTGGSFTPVTQKPFTNTSVERRAPHGSLVTVPDRWYYSVYEGVVSGSFNMSAALDSESKDWAGRPAPLETGLNYPMHGDPNGRYSPVEVPRIDPDLLSQAEVKALNKLRDKSGTNSPDYGMWFAERRETAGLFRDAATGTAKLAQHIARRDLSGSVGVLRDAFGVEATRVGELKRMKRMERWFKRQRIKDPVLQGLESSKDAWLTYKLGVSPLMNDLADAHSRLLSGDLTAKLCVSASAKHSRQAQGQDWQWWVTPLGKIDAVTDMHDLNGYTVTLVAEPLFTEQARLSRLGLANPASLAYQATSLTFAWDYFLALGDFLSSINVPMEFSWREGSFTHRAVRKITLTVTSPGGRKAVGAYNLNHTQRKLYTSFPVPIPPLSLKGKDLHADQDVTLAALALDRLQSLFPQLKPQGRSFNRS